MFIGLRSHVKPKVVPFQCGVGVAVAMVTKGVCSFSTLVGRFAGSCKRLESCDSLKLFVVEMVSSVRELVEFVRVQPAELYLLAT